MVRRRVIGDPDTLPVPANGILQSARALHDRDLHDVARAAVRASKRTVKTVAWLGREETLLAYGLAALRELEARDLEGINTSYIREAALDVVQALRTRQGDDNARPTRLRGIVPGVLIKYRDPSWMATPELHARHRAALLAGPHGVWYASRHPWRVQTSLDGPPDTRLPAHRDGTIGTRWQMDTAKDWGERVDVRDAREPSD